MNTIPYEPVKRLAVMADMAGCPNRCRHCWLGHKPNGSMSREDFREIAAEFRRYRDERGDPIERLGFFSWWREPDFRSDYRELWELEKELSDPGEAKRFELLSTWRLARDETYAPWAVSVGPKVCQITFFGMEETTDWAMGRKGAFRDQLSAAKRCRDAGIEPRWQLFPLKRSLGELDEFQKLMEDAGVKSFFLNGFTPEGAGIDLWDDRLEKEDLAAIPPELKARSQDGLRSLGVPERELFGKLSEEQSPPQIGVQIPALAVDASFDIYPNLAEPAAWWRLGNLRTDGVEKVMRVFKNRGTPGMRANEEIPLGVLVRRFGDPEGNKLFTRGDYLALLLHRWGEAEYRPDR